MGLFDSTLGAFLLGAFANLFLCGVTSVQAFNYFNVYTDDRAAYKVLVAVLLVLNLFHSGLAMHSVYILTVTNFGDLAALANSPWSFSIEPAVTGVVTTLVHGFYIFRVWIASGFNVPLVGLISTLSLVQLGFSWGATGMIFNYDQKFARFTDWSYGVSVWLVSAALADVIITASLIYYLKRADKDQQHSGAIQKLLSNTISNNALTAAVAVVDAVLFIGLSNTSWHVLPQLTLVKLYIMGNLTWLNSRRKLSSMLSASSGNGGGGGGTKGQQTTARATGFRTKDIGHVTSLDHESGLRGGFQIFDSTHAPQPAVSSTSRWARWPAVRSMDGIGSRATNDEDGESIGITSGGSYAMPEMYGQKPVPVAFPPTAAHHGPMDKGFPSPANTSLYSTASSADDRRPEHEFAAVKHPYSFSQDLH